MPSEAIVAVTAQVPVALVIVIVAPLSEQPLELPIE